MGKNGFTAEQMITAIQDSNGILAVAARKLGCTRQTVHNYVNKFATVKAAYHDARENNIDYVEGQLMTAIKNGSVPAIMFFLKTVGKHRGYVERQELAGVKNEPLVVEYVNDWRNAEDTTS